MVTPPSSTYRLQIRKSFTLDDAAALVGYLRDLGVGAVYLSPILASTTGSDHGYDTTDPLRIDPDRGGEEGWAALLAAAADAGLQVVVDIVPNHLGITVGAREPVLVGRADGTGRRRRTRTGSTSTGVARSPSRCWATTRC